jgi:hypothetical protein
MIVMQWYINILNVLLSYLKMSAAECGGVSLKVLAMIPLEEILREPIEGIHYAKMTQFSLLRYLILKILSYFLFLVSRQIT